MKETDQEDGEITPQKDGDGTANENSSKNFTNGSKKSRYGKASNFNELKRNKPEGVKSTGILMVDTQKTARLASLGSLPGEKEDPAT